MTIPYCGRKKEVRMKIPSLLLCANWKMNKSREESKRYIEYMIQSVDYEDRKYLAFFVPALNISIVSDMLKDQGFLWGGQNCHFEDQGAFTGENSPKVFKEWGAHFCLVGHSERRQLFLEDETLIGKKIKALLKNEVCPILCVGETEEEKRKGHSFEVIQRQLKSAFEPILPSLKTVVGIVYEPVWAVGSGQTPKPSDIREMQKFIHQQCKSLGRKVFVLYGGSLNEDNIRNFFPIEGLSGFLVGGKSLKPDEFLSLFHLIKQS